ncbi:sporulation membrane protein YtaF [Brevibacillus sp. H7]|uniref:sporulation membrane protein YtaF n=1 Tax=Brevibacillus sp. H7 TaxID=3349138 RepID=UPI003809E0A2
MSGWLSLFLVSLAISMDSASVGMTYGLRKMRIPLGSLLVIAGCSFTVVYTVMTVGNTLSAWLTPELSKRIGAGVLVAIGVITLWRMWLPRRHAAVSHREADHAAETVEEKLISQFRAFGLIIQILRDPAQADADCSGHIIGWEAVMLGLALSLDAFGAGISLTFLGYPPLVVSGSVALMSGMLLFAGITIGGKVGKNRWLSRLTWLPPLMLICIGLIKSFS